MSRGYSVPNCPWCGMVSRVSPEHHHEWETVHMTCGSEIYPPRSTSPSEQSDACKRIAVLASELQATRAELERVRSAMALADKALEWSNYAADHPARAGLRAALASMETGRG